MIRINLARKKPLSSSSAGAYAVSGGSGFSLRSVFEGRGGDIWTVVSVIGIPLALGFAANEFFDDYVQRRTAEIQKQISDRGKEKEKLTRELQSVKGYEAIKQQLEQNSTVIRNKIDTIEKLIRDRDFATKSLIALAQAMPKEAWISEYSIGEKGYQIRGSSLDAGLISELMSKLQKSIYFSNLQLMSSSSTDGQGMKADFSLQGKVE
ncbi:MAG: PilN domain-containing protein [Bdellovibrionales bacterium]|nr:PilN domain-containing protein [Bdellovibrionales bacterium]